MRLWLKHSTDHTHIYEVLAYNPVTHVGTIQGKLGVYETPLWPYMLKRSGYTYVTENDHAQQPIV
jgi:hypothetical protein